MQRLVVNIELKTYECLFKERKWSIELKMNSRLKKKRLREKKEF